MAYLTELAAKHIRDNNLKGRTPIYSASRFVRLLGDLKPDEITEHHIATYRQKCVELGMSARTIETSIGNIATVLRFAAGKQIATGRRLRQNPPEPSPVELSSIAAVYSARSLAGMLWGVEFHR